jgi:lantibiotic modifying enzyme
MLAPEDLRTLASKAASLDERLDAARRARPHRGLTASEPPLLGTWRRAASGGDPEAFERRLSWDGFDESDARRALADPSLCVPASPPAWTSLLTEAFARFTEDEGVSPRPDDPPFADVWRPFVRAARARLDTASPGWRGALADAAATSLEKRLLARLAAAGERVLYADFDAFRAARPGGEAGAFAAFVERMREGGLAAILCGHSVLARHVAFLADAHVQSVFELVARLSSAAEPLRRLFGAEGRVAAVESGLSDAHAGGRSVLLLAFENGARAVYKPRDLRAEAAWNGVLSWLAGRGAPVPAPLAVLACEDWGLAALAVPGALPDRAAAETYFERAGGLLFAAWLLGLRDLHLDNVLATREGPAVLDAECVLSAPFAGEAGAAFEATDTGLLGMPQLDAGGSAADLGGLTAGGGHSVGSRTAFVPANGDAMRPVALTVRVGPRENRPLLGGAPAVPGRFAASVVAGFGTAARVALRHRVAFGAEDGPLAAFRGARTRVLFRTSDVYARVVDALADPANLRDGAARDVALEALGRAFARDTSRPLLWPLAREEREALRRFDIPAFAARAEDRGLTSASGERVEGLFAASGLEAAAARLASLSEEEIRRQEALVAARLEGGAATGAGTPGASAAELARVAREIAATVLAAAGAPDAANGAGLYGGAAGAALFLGAFGSAEGDARARAAARRLSAGAAASATAGEAGGVVYALAVLASITGDGAYLDDAGRAAARLSREALASLGTHDVEGGLAGALLGLLALAAADGSGEWRTRAVDCGERLLAARRDPGAGLAAWARPDGFLATGFAHGASGVAAALAALGAATGRADFRSAAADACRFERTLFDPARGNWRTGARNGRPDAGARLAWCYGAPGIALARLAVLDAGVDEGAAEDLARALDATRRAPLLATDDVCCGNAGLAEALLAGAEATGGSGLKEAACERLAAAAARAAGRGGFSLEGAPTGAPARLGFFRGLAGVGWAYLHAAGAIPAAPAVLAFAPARPARVA